MNNNKFEHLTADEIIESLEEKYKDNEEAMEDIERAKKNIEYIKRQENYKGQTPHSHAVMLANSLEYWN